ncbi:type II toxin-antitoxin system RelE/ParE family toxin [bacterium]|nr:type II toxin-antitoxin system RelE/ParE family toxin [bacterium]
MKFNIELTARAIKDLKKLSKNSQKQILNEILKLESAPFQYKNKIKKIRGIKFPCYRLRVDLLSNSFRIFYGIEKNNIFILRIVSKKDADIIIQRIRQSDFPPE